MFYSGGMMASPKLAVWDKAGRPFKVAAPIVYVVNYCKRKAIANLGTIGNTDHLTADPPEDHTPYSDTAWPNRLPLAVLVDGERYWVCAGDFGNEKGLGAAILRDARAGLLPWLKYLNVGGMHYTFADGFKQGRPNPDQHIHLSTFDDPDSLTYDCEGWDPLAGIPPRKEAPTMMRFVRVPSTPWVYLTDGNTARWMQDETERDYWKKALNMPPEMAITQTLFARLVIVGVKPQ
jgi:hypothetical protein